MVGGREEGVWIMRCIKACPSSFSASSPMELMLPAILEGTSAFCSMQMCLDEEAQRQKDDQLYQGLDRWTDGWMDGRIGGLMEEYKFGNRVNA